MRESPHQSPWSRPMHEDPEFQRNNPPTPPPRRHPVNPRQGGILSVLGLVVLVLLSGCSSNDICASDEDCFSGEVCRDQTCVLKGDGPAEHDLDASLDTDPGSDGDADMSGGSDADTPPDLALPPCTGQTPTRCGARCVDTTSDPTACGECATSCASGSVCDGGECTVVNDCTQEGCVGLSWCDLSTGVCTPGCARDSQCAGGQVCDLATHTCICEPGRVDCAGVCTREDADHCGLSCLACPSDPLGQAACTAQGVCDLTCEPGARLCGGACAMCPQGEGVEATTCQEAACVASACAPGRELCDGVCAACPSGADEVGCDGVRCVASSCPGGTKLCAGACASCPARDPNGQLSCNAAACETVCQTGFHLCRGVCVSDAGRRQLRQPLQPMRFGPDGAGDLFPGRVWRELR